MWVRRSCYMRICSLVLFEFKWNQPLTKTFKSICKNIFYVSAVNNYCTYIFKGSNYRFLGLLSKKHISRTAFFVISIRAVPHVPDGTFRKINSHSKNRRKECQFILHFLDSPWYQQIRKKKFFTNTSHIFSIALDGTQKHKIF